MQQQHLTDRSLLVIVEFGGVFCCGWNINFSLLLSYVLLYIFFSKLYRESERIVLIDFGVTCGLAFFWFVASCAWASGLSGLKYGLSFENVKLRVPICSKEGSACTELQNATFATANISVLFGFMCVVLWLGSVWFVYKETRFHAPRQSQQQHEQYQNNPGVAPPFNEP